MTSVTPLFEVSNPLEVLIHHMPRGRRMRELLADLPAANEARTHLAAQFGVILPKGVVEKWEGRLRTKTRDESFGGGAYGAGGPDRTVRSFEFSVPIEA